MSYLSWHSSCSPGRVLVSAQGFLPRLPVYSLPWPSTAALSSCTPPRPSSAPGAVTAAASASRRKRQAFFDLPPLDMLIVTWKRWWVIETRWVRKTQTHKKQIACLSHLVVPRNETKQDWSLIIYNLRRKILFLRSRQASPSTPLRSNRVLVAPSITLLWSAAAPELENRHSI